MRTEDFADLLARGAGRANAGDLSRRAALASGAAVLGALALTGGCLGWNPALAAVVRTPMFWCKLLFCAALGAAAAVAALRAARPGRGLGAAPYAAALAVALMWLLGAAALLPAPPADRVALLMGRTALVCPLLIAAVSLPGCVAMLWLMRAAAPTRLGRAGAWAGFAAGALGACAYCLHCPEFAAPFIGVWYVLGMLIPAALGALAGPRLLRW